MGENNNEKKKQIILILVGVVTMLVAVLGATYAYFKISTNNESSNTIITGKTPPKSLVTLIPGTNNLHLNISASDMSYENRTREYFGTDGKDPYVGKEELGTKTIAQVELTGGEATTKYSCTAKLTVSKVTEPEEDKDTMIEVLQPDDMILQFKGDIISDKLDLSELKETGSKEYNIKFNISGNATKDIEAYIKLINKDEPQNYLAGKKLNIDISTSELKCNVVNVSTTIEKLRYEDTKGYLSPEPNQGEMYRYQGAFEDGDSSAMTNWIIFGITEKCEKDAEEKCTNLNMTYEDYVDKYMYRIIGITEEGQMYLIKETFLKEGTLPAFSWNDKYETSGTGVSVCENKICPEWGQNTLFKRINGTSNGETPGTGQCSRTCDGSNTDIFVDSEYYNYLKSGDNINGTKDNKGSKWYQLIVDHNWMYGDIGEGSNDVLNKYEVQPVYEIETGQADVKHYVGTDGKNNEETYNWKNNPTLKAKVGLMYIHDYYYGYYDGSTEESRGNARSNSELKNSWLFFQKDGYNTQLGYEWFSTRTGLAIADLSCVSSRYVFIDGSVGTGNPMYTLSTPHGVRPVFYLSQNAKIKSGNGTKTDPYILDVQA